MRISKQIRSALESAVKKSGGQALFSKKTGIAQPTLSRYLTGQITDMHLSSLKKIYPHILPFLPSDHFTLFDIKLQWELAPLNPLIRAHIERIGVAAQEQVDKLARDVIQFGMELGVDIYDQLTMDLLKYWQKLPLTKRYLVMSYIARVAEDDFPVTEGEPAKKVAGH